MTVARGTTPARVRDIPRYFAGAASCAQVAGSRNDIESIAVAERKNLNLSTSICLSFNLVLSFLSAHGRKDHNGLQNSEFQPALAVKARKIDHQLILFEANV